MPFEKIAIAGASGYLGRKILNHLLTLPTISHITVLTRSESSSKFTSSPALSVVSVLSYEDTAALAAALQGHDLLISALPAEAAVKADEVFLAAAIAAGVKRYMPAEYTVDCMHPDAIAIAGHTVLAGKIANAKRIQQLADEGKIEYTTFVTGAFLDFWIENPTPVAVAKAKTTTLLDGGEKMMTGVTTEFIAKCIGALLTRPEEFPKNQRIRIAEVEFTGKRLLEAFEEVTGEKWTVLEKTTDAALQDAMKALEAGDMRGFYLGNIIKINFNGEGAGYYEEGMKWLDGSIERRSLNEIVKKSLGHTESK